MNHRDRNPNEPEQDAIGALLKIAGPRPEVDELAKMRVERAVRAAWRNGLRRRRMRQWVYATAAGFVTLAAVIGLRQERTSAPAADIAVVVSIRGTATRANGSARSVLSVGDRLPKGTSIVTDKGGYVSLSLARMDSVRLDHGTELTLRSERVLTLSRGAVYLDSGDRSGGLSVSTPELQASDIGTRFMVRRDAPGHSAVSVRDGSVEVAVGSTSLLQGGEGLRVGADRRVERVRIAPNAAEWTWVRHAAVPFAAEGRSIEELLNWYARESGLRLSVEDDPLLRQRLRAPLQGDLQGLAPEDLLEVASVAGDFKLTTLWDIGELHVSK